MDEILLRCRVDGLEDLGEESERIVLLPVLHEIHELAAHGLELRAVREQLAPSRFTLPDALDS